MHGISWRQSGSSKLHPAQTDMYVLSQVLVCGDFKGEDAESLVELSEAAVQLGGKYLVLHVDSKNDENEPIMKRVGTSLAECPAVRVADLNKGFVVWMPREPQDAQVGRQYAFNTAAGLTSLAHDFEKRQLRRLLNSEPRPTKLTQPVTRIVGSMFNETVMDVPGDVVLYVNMSAQHVRWIAVHCIQANVSYQPVLTLVFLPLQCRYLYMDGCPHCKKFTKIFKSVALELKSTDTDITFLSIRGTRNDLDHDEVGVPCCDRILRHRVENQSFVIHAHFVCLGVCLSVVIFASLAVPPTQEHISLHLARRKLLMSPYYAVFNSIRVSISIPVEVKLC